MASMKLDESQPANEQLMFAEVRELCKASGASIDKIAKDCNIRQDLISKLYMELMQQILDKTNRSTE